MKYITLLITAIVAFATMALAQSNIPSGTNPPQINYPSPTSQTAKKTSGIEEILTSGIAQNSNNIQTLRSNLKQLKKVPLLLNQIQKRQVSNEHLLRENASSLINGQIRQKQTNSKLKSFESDLIVIDEKLLDLETQMYELNSFAKENHKKLESMAIQHEINNRLELQKKAHDFKHENQNSDLSLELIDDGRNTTLVISTTVFLLSALLFTATHWSKIKGQISILLDQYKKHQQPEQLNLAIPAQQKQFLPVQKELNLPATLKESSQPVPPSKTIDSILIQEPGVLLNDLIGQTTSMKSEVVLNAPWESGMACIKGEVRDENQDYALAFSMDTFQVGLVADGMGGLDYGRYASYSAIRAAAKSILNKLKPNTPEDDLLGICHAAMEEASKSLASISNTFSISSDSGLRTTLIICIGSSNKWNLYYSGDGGATLVRKEGCIQQLLKPQRDNPDLTHVLSGSLGPELEGIPFPVSLIRQPGDVMILGSDGVSEMVSEYFGYDVLKCAFHHKGNLEQAAQAITHSMSQQKDEFGYICNDNLSLVCLCDGTPPKVTSQFGNTLFEMKPEATL